MVEETINSFGAVDILVNNAAVEGLPGLTTDLPEEQWDRLMSVNLKGVFLCSQAVIPQMRTQNKGRIVNIGSVAGLRMSFFGGPEYTAAKYGVAGFTQHLAWEVADAISLSISLLRVTY